MGKKLRYSVLDRMPNREEYAGRSGCAHRCAALRLARAGLPRCPRSYPAGVMMPRTSANRT